MLTQAPPGQVHEDVFERALVIECPEALVDEEGVETDAAGRRGDNVCEPEG
mgnify:CR=1 FL=1